MTEGLFSSYGKTESSTTVRRPRKGAIIGAGQVGMASAYSMLIQNTLDELVLVDVDQVKLEGARARFGFSTRTGGMRELYLHSLRVVRN